MTDNPENIGRALLRLQDHIHAIGRGPNYGVMNNAYFTQAVSVAEDIIGGWLMHPSGRGWALIDEIDQFIKNRPEVEHD